LDALNAPGKLSALVALAANPAPALKTSAQKIADITKREFFTALLFFKIFPPMASIF
jgi:hypothetical protein